jgi:hypothetical protein
LEPDHDYFPFLQRLYHVGQFPMRLGQASRYRWRTTKRFLNADKIVVHEVNRDAMRVVRGVLAKRVG